MGANLSRIQIAAALGDATALAAVNGAPVQLPTHYRSRIEMAVGPLSRKEKVQFAIECAERALGFWNEFDAKDSNPSEAIAAARRWARGATSKAEADAAGNLASDSAARAQMAYDASEDLKTIDQASPNGQMAARAEWAAVSAAHAAFTAAADDEEVDYCCAYAAKGAFKATLESAEERAWQEERLADHLLG